MRKLFGRDRKEITIQPNQTFLHERDRYERGRRYKVSIELARYFAHNGWLRGTQPNEEPVDLDIDDSTLGHQGGPE